MPSTGALFGNSASRNQTKNLMELKAGKMSMKGKMVHPDKRKGLLYIYQSDDSLMHFCWKDRTSGSVEDDLIIFPDDCEFKRVEQCTTGRVYILKFKSPSKKFFFWLQEPKTEKDEENCKKINEMLNNPPIAGSTRSGGATPDGNLHNLLCSMSEQQLMQLFGTFGTGGGSGSGAGQLGGLSNLLGTMNRGSAARQGGTSAPSSTTTSAPATAPPSDPSTRTSTASSTSSARPATEAADASGAAAAAGNQIQLSDLQKFLSNLTQSPSPPGNVDLAEALNSESIAGVVADPTLVRQLLPHLPNVGETDASTTQQLRSTLASPQFQQAVSMFSAALQSGQLGPVVQQFEVGENAVTAANQGNMEEFVKALEETDLNKESKSGSSEQEEPKQPEKKKKTEETRKKDKEGGNGKKGEDDEGDSMSLD